LLLAIYIQLSISITDPSEMSSLTDLIAKYAELKSEYGTLASGPLPGSLGHLPLLEQNVNSLQEIVNLLREKERQNQELLRENQELLRENQELLRKNQKLHRNNQEYQDEIDYLWETIEDNHVDYLIQNEKYEILKEKKNTPKKRMGVKPWLPRSLKALVKKTFGKGALSSESKKPLQREPSFDGWLSDRK
jgi:hypothetical protein